MIKKYRLSVRATQRAIVEPITKFGGQPVWIAEPHWPLSKTTGEPMRFLAQFEIYPEIFGPCAGKMAYLFMTDGATFVKGTWTPEGGENAVIVQPGIWNGPIAALHNGPTLYENVTNQGGTEVRAIPCEYEVVLEAGTDPDQLDEMDFRARGMWDDYCKYAAESKIGGTPAFQESPEYPSPGEWRLLAQIASTVVPCGINFGDSGTGYAFLSARGDVAKFLWQG